MSCVPKNCNTCAFECMVNKGVTPYCVLKRFPILNPEIGCSRQMTKGEFESKKCNEKKINIYITAEEIEAAKIAEIENEGS